jgi:DUF917 family protein
MRQITEHDLDDLAVGAAILGTGGGGDPYIGKLLAQQAIREHGPVTLVDVDELADDAVVIPVAMMGAPTIMIEKLASGEEILAAVDAVASYLGREMTHTIPAEVGGINSVFPFVVAAKRGLPIVDADLMGRAFPELQMVIPTMYGISATPMAMADEKGNTVVLNTIDNHWTERFARSVVIDMGASSMITLYALDGAQAREVTVRGTLGLSQELGRIVRETRAAHGDAVAAATERLGGVRLFGGKIGDVARRTEGGFARLEARVDGLGDDAGSTLLVRSQNEHLVAERDGQVVASTPDLIMVFDSDSGEPITTETLRYGFRVTVVGAPCDPRWRSADGLALAGPRYFGYDVDYVPVEELAGARRLA